MVVHLFNQVASDTPMAQHQCIMQYVLEIKWRPSEETLQHRLNRWCQDRRQCIQRIIVQKWCQARKSHTFGTDWTDSASEHCTGAMESAEVRSATAMWRSSVIGLTDTQSSVKPTVLQACQEVQRLVQMLCVTGWADAYPSDEPMPTQNSC